LSQFPDPERAEGVDDAAADEAVAERDSLDHLVVGAELDE
jgi:hypothetical protein